MDKQLHLTLGVGWFAGIFPVNNFTSLKYSMYHPIFLYSVLLLSFYLSCEICVFINDKKAMSKLPLSKVIILYLINMTGAITCFTLRTWHLCRGPKIAELLHQLVVLRKEADLNPNLKQKQSYIFKYYILGYCILLVDLFVISFRVNEWLEGHYDKVEYDLGFTVVPSALAIFMLLYKDFLLVVTKYFVLALIIYMGVQLLFIFEHFCYDLQKLYCIEAVSSVHMVDSDSDDDDDDDETDIDTDNGNDNLQERADSNENQVSRKKIEKKLQLEKNMVNNSEVFSDFSAKFPAVFGNYWGTPVIPYDENDHENSNIINRNGKGLEDKKSLWFGNKLSTISSSNNMNMNTNPMNTIVQPMNFKTSRDFSLKDLSARFLRIQQCFDDYNKVAGFSFFIFLCHSSIALIHKFYLIASSDVDFGDSRQNIQFMARVSVAFLVICGLCHLGDIIVSKMRKWREQLKCIMLTELLCNSFHDSTNTLTESICKWDWELTALNLFSINHALLPALVATCVTYLIVIIQLKVSENAEMGNSTSRVENITILSADALEQ